MIILFAALHAEAQHRLRHRCQRRVRGRLHGNGSVRQRRIKSDDNNGHNGSTGNAFHM